MVQTLDEIKMTIGTAGAAPGELPGELLVF